MLGFWLRWSLRDLRQRWLLVTSIALTVALGTGTYAALSSTKEWRYQSNDASFALLHLHDLRVELSQGSTAAQGRLAAIVRSIPSSARLERVRERLLVPTQVSATARGRDVIVSATVVGHPQPAGETVDGLWVKRGTAPTGSTFADGTVVLEHKFATYYGLPDSGTLQLTGDRRVAYSGVGAAPEELLVTGREGTSFLGEAAYATVYGTLAAAQSLDPALRGRVNDVVLTLRAGTDTGRVEQELRAAFQQASPPVAADVLDRQDSSAYRILYDDIEGDDRFWLVVAALILLGATFAAVNLTTRVVEAQRREIGIGMALGVGPRALAIRPLLLGVELALLGTGLGVLVALAISEPLKSLYTSVLPLPVWRTPLQLAPFVRASVAGILLPMLAVVVPVWRAVRVQPVEAIRVGHLVARTSPLLGASRWLRVPGRGYRAIPLRNLVRTPRRTALTALAVAASIMTLVAIGGLLDSFRASVAAGEDELSRGAPDRLIVSLDAWYAATSPEVRQAVAVPGVATAALGLQAPMTVRAGGTSLDLLSEVLPVDSPWQPSLVSGSGQGGLVLAEKAAADLGVEVGDTVSVRYPQPTATGARTVEREVLVAGVHPNPLRVLAYADAPTGASLGLAGVVNRLQLLPAEGTTLDALRKALFGIRAVASVEDVNSTTKVFDDALEQFTGILVIMAGAVLALALLITYNSATISVDERAREHATMLAFGLPVRTLVGMLTVESALTGLLGSVLGLGGGLLVLQWMMDYLMSETLPDFGIRPLVGRFTVQGTLLVGVGAAALAPLLTIRRLRRLDVPSTLRVVE
jgi:putative ABC transport system permease protein